MHYSHTLTNDVTLRSDITRAGLQILAVTAAMAIGALIKIPLPFTPVPLTLQTLPVLAAAFAVGPTRAMAGILLYIGLGMAGVPVLAVSFGPTFGYLVAFAAVPWVVSAIRNSALALVAGQTAIYAFGAGWLALWLHVSPLAALTMGVLPFVFGDILKGTAAYALIRTARR